MSEQTDRVEHIGPITNPGRPMGKQPSSASHREVAEAIRVAVLSLMENCVEEQDIDDRIAAVLAAEGVQQPDGATEQTDMPCPNCGKRDVTRRMGKIAYLACGECKEAWTASGFRNATDEIKRLEQQLAALRAEIAVGNGSRDVRSTGESGG